MTTPSRYQQNDTVHVVIPDTQAKRYVPTKHLEWAGRYIGEKFAGRPKVKLIHLGDHWDMPSLSSYDRKGGTKMEGRRYDHDVTAGNEAWELFNDAIVTAAAKAGAKGWFPESWFLFGNHEERIVRAANDDAVLDGTVTLDHLAVVHDKRWKTAEFLKPVWLDGVAYAHYFTARGTGRPLGGQSIDARIKTIGHSFTQGHQQGLWNGRREVIGGAHLGLVAGSCYLHDEDYLGPQGNRHWRGIIVCYDVRRGDYDPKFVSLNSLCKRYEGKTLAQFKGRH